MVYCGAAAGPGMHHLCVLEEVRETEPPIRLRASYYDPGETARIAGQLRALEDVVVAVAAPMTTPRNRDERACDRELRRRGVPPLAQSPAGRELFEALSDLGLYAPDTDRTEGRVDEGSYRGAPVFETNVDGVFSALKGRRVPAKRHPLGIQVRVQELLEDHVVDENGSLWARRIEEIEASAAALCAHRYAVGHACWLGDPPEGVVVLPGSAVPERFSSEGVVPDVPRLPLRGG